MAHTESGGPRKDTLIPARVQRFSRREIVDGEEILVPLITRSFAGIHPDGHTYGLDITSSQQYPSVSFTRATFLSGLRKLEISGGGEITTLNLTGSAQIDFREDDRIIDDVSVSDGAHFKGYIVEKATAIGFGRSGGSTSEVVVEAANEVEVTQGGRAEVKSAKKVTVLNAGSKFYSGHGWETNNGNIEHLIADGSVVPEDITDSVAHVAVGRVGFAELVANVSATIDNADEVHVKGKKVKVNDKLLEEGKKYFIENGEVYEILQPTEIIEESDGKKRIRFDRGEEGSFELVGELDPERVSVLANTARNVMVRYRSNFRDDDDGDLEEFDDLSSGREDSPITTVDVAIRGQAVIIDDKEGLVVNKAEVFGGFLQAKRIKHGYAEGTDASVTATAQDENNIVEDMLILDGAWAKAGNAKFLCALGGNTQMIFDRARIFVQGEESAPATVIGEVYDASYLLGGVKANLSLSRKDAYAYLVVEGAGNVVNGEERVPDVYVIFRDIEDGGKIKIDTAERSGYGNPLNIGLGDGLRQASELLRTWSVDETKIRTSSIDNIEL